MSANHEPQLELCAALAVGSIDPAERRALEEHLDAGCGVCAAFLREACGPLEALALCLPPAAPPRGLKARVLVAVARRPTASRAPEELPGSAAPRASRRWAPRLPAWAWTAFALLLAGGAVGWWRAGVLAERVRDLEARAPGPSNPVAARAEFRARHPRATETTLVARPGADPARSVRVLFDAQARRALVLLEGFAEPVSGALELWTVRGSACTSEGLLHVDADGRAAARIENVGDPALLTGFAISAEPPGGAPDRRRPTSILYASP